MKILTVIETLGAGGAERALLTLLPALGQRGHECEVAVLRPPMTLEPEFSARGVPVHHLGLRHRWDLPRGVARVSVLARRGQFDVVHGHLFFGGLYVAMARPFAPGTAGLVTFHNLGYDSYPANTTWRKARKRVDTVAMRSLDRRVAVSEAAASHYRTHLGLRDCDVVPNGLDLSAVQSHHGDRRETSLRLGVDPDRPLLVAVGRFVPEKSHGDLIAALRLVRDRNASVQLVLVGDGPRRADVENAVRTAGVTDAVVLAGTRPHHEVLDIVAAADIFVSSSVHEGFSLATAEAMALGRPVAVTSVGGVPEIVGHDGAGRLVPAGQPEALARVILELLGDPAAAAACGELGRRRIEERFSIQVVAEQLESVYEAALTSRRREAR
ncbi:MAG: glycosyltransferase [Acidimicrobiales bacterium]